jgi:Zn-dependent protease with chaperone function
LNFFEHQELARRNSRVLVLLYAMAVAAVVAGVTLAIAGVWLYAHGARQPEPVSVADVPAALWWTCALGTLAVIFAVSAVQTLRLGTSGEAVAKLAGARPVPPETRDPLERRLLNVVEEMAIAAGVRVPKVYMMAEERAVNAFAAGLDTSNAVVAVTRGTLETLNRDELQGVVAHEFSHILHGDMRLNVRMIGVLAGIVFIGALGAFVLRGAGHAGGRREGAAALLAVGLALFVIGYTGLFFARIIKAAISRQREFLADASSVQYTRNPEGIAGALDQIRASARGTLIANRYAEDMSHMYFGNSIRFGLAGLFATHPPIDERISRVYPGFTPTRYRQRRADVLAPDDDAVRRRRAAEGVLEVAVLAERPWGRTPQASAQLVGELDDENVRRAQRLLEALPAALREAAHHPDGARAAVLSLVGPPEGRPAPELHLPLVDLALPALRRLETGARNELLAALEAAIRADQRVSLHEFVLLALLRHELAPPPPARGEARLAARRAEAVTLLSLIAHASHADTAAAFRAGAYELGIEGAAALAREVLTPERAGEALERLRALGPRDKSRLVQALFAAAAADGRIRLGEAELLRLAGAVLDCPIAPLFD